MDTIPLMIRFAVSLVICSVFMPLYIRRAVKGKMTGTDIHKKNRPEIAEAGGIVLTLAYVLGLFSMIPNYGLGGDGIVSIIIATGATVLLCAFCGFVES